MKCAEKVLRVNGSMFKAAFEKYTTLLEIRQWTDPVLSTNTVILVRKAQGSDRLLASYVKHATLAKIQGRMFMHDNVQQLSTDKTFWVPASEMDKVTEDFNFRYTRERLALLPPKIVIPATGNISNIAGDIIYGWFKDHPRLDAVGRRRHLLPAAFSFNWLLRMKDNDGRRYVKLIEDIDAYTQIGLVLYKWTRNVCQTGILPWEDLRDSDAFELIAERSKLSSLLQTEVVGDKGAMERCSKCGSDNAPSDGCWRTGVDGAFLCDECDDPPAPTCTACSCSLQTNARGQRGLDVCGECYLKRQPVQKVEAVPRLFARSAKPRPVDRKHDPRPGIDDRGAWATPTWEDDT